MFRRFWIGFALCSGCAHQPNAEPVGVSPNDSPILPALQGKRYSHSSGQSRDPLVAQVLHESGLDWDESLSGAAGGIALGRHAAHLDGAQWSAIVAGYPYPVVNLIQGETAPGAWPEGLLDTLKSLTLPEDDVGLVRARRGDQDIWMGLIGRPPFVLAPLNKEVEPGAQIRVQTIDDGLFRYTLVSPTGQIQQGELPESVTLAQIGEWWIEVKQEPEGGQLGLPIYVGMKTPDLSLLELPGRSVASEQGAMAEAEVLLQQIRDDFGLGPLQEDGTLSALAQRPLEEQLAGEWDAIAGVERLRAAGFIGDSTAQVSCAAETVAGCLSDILEQAKPRSALLQPDQAIFGLRAKVHPEGVQMMINLAAQ